MRATKVSHIFAVQLLFLALLGCGLSSDTQPTSLSVPTDVFPSETPGTKDFRPSADFTIHPVYFFKDDLLTEINAPFQLLCFLMRH